MNFFVFIRNLNKTTIGNVICEPGKQKYIDSFKNVQKGTTKMIYKRFRGEMIETYKLLSGMYNTEIECLIKLRPEIDITY